MNAVAQLVERFASVPAADCLRVGGIGWTYGDLVAAIARDREALAAAGIRAGHLVVTTGAFTPVHVSLFFAASSLQAVTVPLPDVGTDEVERSLATIGPASLIRVGGDRWTIERVETPPSHALLVALRARGESGLIVFTSGSTGEKKAILHSVEKLASKFLERRPAFRTLAFLRWDHMGGINTVLHALSNCGFLVVPASRRPVDVASAIETFRIQLLPATPSFLNLTLLAGDAVIEAFRRLEVITYGTELMTASTLARLREALPGVRLQQTYGLSELGVLRSKSRSSDSLFVKLGGEGFETKVVDGMLWVRAASTMEGYLNAPNPPMQDGWYNTGDRVEVDGEYVRFLGRDSDVINVGGEKVFPGEVESFLTGLPDVVDASVTGERNPILGQVVVASIVLAPGVDATGAVGRVRAACRAGLRRHMVPVKVHCVPELVYSDRFKKVRAGAAT